MNKMKFNITIYLDPIYLLDNAASKSDSINIVDEMIAQINHGDPVWEDLIEEVAEEIVGEEENEEKKQEIIDQLSELDKDELKKYISYTGQAEIDYDEQYEAGNDVSVFRVCGEFDTDKFAKDFDFSKEDDKEL